MALAFTESTVDDLLRRTYLAIREEGQPVSPTRAASHELIGVSLELTQPRCRLSRVRGAVLAPGEDICRSEDGIPHSGPRFGNLPRFGRGAGELSPRLCRGLRA